MLTRAMTAALLLALSLSSYADTPSSFRQAKVWAKEYVYLDRNTSDYGTLYCGCQWRWTGESGGRIDLEGCGYEIRAQENRAKRIEWEHIMPAHSLGHQRQCWQEGGRRNCVSNDAVFNVMYVDLFNLTPVVGEFNADRSNYRFTQFPASAPYQHGACPSRVDFSQRAAEPRPEARGLVARTYMYMHDRYNLPMSRAQQQIMMAWDRQYPVTDWERVRHDRIAAVMGHENPFVTGAKTWSLGHTNSGEGLRHAGSSLSAKDSHSIDLPGPIHGNRNSKVYHLPTGCPSYNAMADRNRVEFSSEAEAIAAGYRKAGNCR
ncbi:endonuclease [Marinobacter sp. P4B1]|uniref:endonuclease n=1 Tax=Marinobacter sp. P4B1 TaxID=1119533 RepID=UPI0011A9C3F0|nr:endonuclease [Marinobacter sp. P4B1]